MDIIDCKKISDARRALLAGIIRQKDLSPRLAIVSVGDDYASSVYVRNKEKACADVGIMCGVVRVPSDTTTEELQTVVRSLAGNPAVNGIIVQLPLPKQVDVDAVIACVPPEKDMDGLTSANMGAAWTDREGLLPCTARGISEVILQATGSVSGASVCIINRSNIVGKPLAGILTNLSATVVLCNSKTPNVEHYTYNSDIVVTAVGKPKFITRDMLRPGTIVIDVSINRDENNKLTGDVDTESVAELAGKRTPVPGGIGPMTVTMLLDNTVQAAVAQKRGV